MKNQPKPLKSPIKAKRSYWAPIFGIIALLALGAAGYMAYQMRELQDPTYQQKLLENKTQNLITDLGKHMELPTDAPQVLTVSDVENLKKSQPFFEKAQNGDTVFIYQNQAVIYRASTDKIINVGPVTRAPEAPAAPVKK